MKPNYYFWAVLLVLAVSAMIFWPSSPDLERLRELYERGQYSAVIAQLEKELKHEPHWHEARELLVWAAMKGGCLDKALLHLTELKRQGQYVQILEGQLTLWLSNRSPGPDHADAAVSTAKDAVDDIPNWMWIKEYYLALLVKLERAGELADAVELVLAGEYPLEFSDEVRVIMTSASSLVAGTGDYHALWRTSRLLDEFTADNHWRWRQHALWSLPDSDAINQLAAKYPGDAVLAAARAEKLGSQEGLRFLREWEQKYSVDSPSLEYYGYTKGNLLREADSVVAADLSWVGTDRLLDLAEQCLEQPEKCRLILDCLQESYPQQVAVVRQALNGPKPVLITSGFRPSISPDGSRLGLFHSGAEIYDLLGNIKNGLTPPAKEGSWFWAPDSSIVALTDYHGPSTISVFNKNGELLNQVELHEEYSLLGWHSATILWLQKKEEGRVPMPFGPLYLCNILTGDEQLSEFQIPGMPVKIYPGPNGSLAWQDGKTIAMQQGDEILQLPGEGKSLISWVPDESGLIVETQGELGLWTGHEPMSLNIRGEFLGWRSLKDFYWAEPVDKLGASKLMGCNIGTKEIRDYGLVGYWRTAAGHTAVAAGREIKVYQLP